jgi:hypothetical protein
MAGSPTFKLFNNVVAPAVMGNTVWALVQVVVERPISGSTVAQVACLALLSLFFLSDWSDDDANATREYLQGNVRDWWVYLTATMFFYMSCAALAIQVAHPYSHWLQISALSLFGLTALGQIGRVWSENPEPQGKKTRRLWSISANVVAAVVVAVFWLVLKPNQVGVNNQSRYDQLDWLIAVALLIATLPYTLSLLRRDGKNR